MDIHQQVEQWGVFELGLSDAAKESAGKPVKAIFTNGRRVREAYAFEDGSGAGRIRFMPDEVGVWEYEIAGSSADQPVHQGRIECTAPHPGNHGPVRIVSDKDFAYADGTPFIPFGTTSLKWYDGEAFEETIAALASSPFNKVRMAAGPADSDMEKLEAAIRRLMELGIEADLLLDCREGGAEAERFLAEAVARLAAFRNVWWSLVLPEELDPPGRQERLRRLLPLLQERDPYRHPLTVQSSDPMSDFSFHPITHVSLRAGDPSQVSHYAGMHGKPVLVEECGCEGNAPSLWGSLPPEELVNRIWNAVCRGGYAAHGEMFTRSGGASWHSHGGSLTGEAAPRLAFLRGILEEAPLGLRFMPAYYDAATIGLEGEYYLQYHGIHRFSTKQLRVPEGRYAADLIDVWNMQITPFSEEFVGSEVFVALPERTNLALRIRRVDSPLQQAPRRYDTARITDPPLLADRLQGQADRQNTISPDEENENFISERERANKNRGGRSDAQQ